MDEMKIKSSFVTGIIASIIRKVIAKNLGCDVTISIREIVVTSTEQGMRVHVNMEGVMPQQEMKKLLEKVGL